MLISVFSQTGYRFWKTSFKSSIGFTDFHKNIVLLWSLSIASSVENDRRSDRETSYSKIWSLSN